MSPLRNDHEYSGEPLEYRHLRLRSNAEDPRPGIDLTDDPTDRFHPATDAWPHTCTHPALVLAGSCSTDAAPTPEPSHQGAAVTSAAGGPGGNRSPAAHPNSEAAV